MQVLNRRKAVRAGAKTPKGAGSPMINGDKGPGLPMTNGDNGDNGPGPPMVNGDNGTGPPKEATASSAGPSPGSYSRRSRRLVNHCPLPGDAGTLSGTILTMCRTSTVS